MDRENVRSYQDLRVWQAGMDLAEKCYLLTKGFPREEIFELTSQIRRSAASVPANISEGYGRDSIGEYIRFLRTAQGSLKETETWLILSQRVDLASVAAASELLEECAALGRMLRALIRSLQNKQKGVAIGPDCQLPTPDCPQ